MKIQSTLSALLIIGALLCLAPNRSAHAATNSPGLPITGANEGLFETVDSTLTCYTPANQVIPVPGSVVRKNGKRYFDSYARQRDRELARLLATGKFKKNDARLKQRRKKLTDKLKAGRAECTLGSDVRRATEVILATAATPTAAFENYLDVISAAIATSTDIPETYARIQTNILSVFRTKADFDNLAAAIQNLGDFIEITGGSAESSSVVISVDSPCPSEFEALLYSLSGVNDSPISALAGSVAIRELASRIDFEKTDTIGFRHFFNTGGLPTTTDGAICRLFLGPIGQATPAAGDNSSVATLPEDLQSLGTAYQDAFNRCLEAYGLSTSQTLSEFLTAAQSYAPDSSEAATLSGLIAQDVQSGRKVVVIAHSQGNILAQTAIDALGSDSTSAYKSSVGLVAVGSPGALASAATYGAVAKYTLGNDVVPDVAGAPAANLENELSQNSALTPETHRFAVHDLVIGYLSESEEQNTIIGTIFTQKTSLTNSRQLVGQGFFQVTLTWDIAGDIDLHVYEPNGAHVYYANKTGVVGKLDRDDIPGDGPENYYVCARSRLQTGNYRVEVNNFGGTTGTLASIAIRGGTQSKTYTVTMGPANGGATNQSVTTVVYDGDLFTLP